MVAPLLVVVTSGELVAVCYTRAAPTGTRPTVVPMLQLRWMRMVPSVDTSQFGSQTCAGVTTRGLLGRLLQQSATAIRHLTAVGGMAVVPRSEALLLSRHLAPVLELVSLASSTTGSLPFARLASHREVRVCGLLHTYVGQATA